MESNKFRYHKAAIGILFQLKKKKKNPDDYKHKLSAQGTTL